jgi:hypothetical protein
MVDYSTFSIVLTGIGLIIALTYYSLQIRNQNKTRQAQTYMPIYARFQEKEFMKKYIDILNLWEWETPQEFHEKYGPRADLDAYSDYMNVNTYFTGIGVLVKRGLIDKELVNDLMGDIVVRFWEKNEDYIYFIRELRDWPTLGEHFEYLYGVMKPMVEQQQSKP